jgi:hypothetical protein
VIKFLVENVSSFLFASFYFLQYVLYIFVETKRGNIYIHIISDLACVQSARAEKEGERIANVNCKFSSEHVGIVTISISYVQFQFSSISSHVLAPPSRVVRS